MESLKTPCFTIQAPEMNFHWFYCYICRFLLNDFTMHTPTLHISFFINSYAQNSDRKIFDVDVTLSDAHTSVCPSLLTLFTFTSDIDQFFV